MPSRLSCPRLYISWYSSRAPRKSILPVPPLLFPPNQKPLAQPGPPPVPPPASVPRSFPVPNPADPLVHPSHFITHHFPGPPMIQRPAGPFRFLSRGLAGSRQHFRPPLSPTLSLALLELRARSTVPPRTGRRECLTYDIPPGLWYCTVDAHAYIHPHPHIILMTD